MPAPHSVGVTIRPAQAACRQQRRPANRRSAAESFEHVRTAHVAPHLAGTVDTAPTAMPTVGADRWDYVHVATRRGAARRVCTSDDSNCVASWDLHPAHWDNQHVATWANAIPRGHSGKFVASNWRILCVVSVAAAKCVRCATRSCRWPACHWSPVRRASDPLHAVWRRRADESARRSAQTAKNYWRCQSQDCRCRVSKERKEVAMSDSRKTDGEGESSLPAVSLAAPATKWRPCAVAA